jgi:hypothetical protein
MRLVGVLFLFVIASCGGSGVGGEAAGASALLLTAGTETLQPAEGRSDAPAEASRFGVLEVGAVYDLTTPPGESFRFEMTARGEAAALGLGHAADGGSVPAGGPETLSLAGVLPLASRLETEGLWLRAEGSGQARITVQGSITEDQTLVVECRDGEAGGFDLVRIRVGPASAINRASGEDDVPEDPYAGIEEEVTIHSSDAWEYGFPAVAQSGSRSTVLVYEGAEGMDADPLFRERRLHELRLQYDRETGEVTGAPPTEVGWENGVFRDHEVAALGNVLAIARATTGGVKVEISFDRGATFGQTETFTEDEAYSLPIVQADLAGDYRLTVAFWRILVLEGEGGGARGDPSSAFDVPKYESQLVLVEGRPADVAEDGTPVAYSFGEPFVLFADGRDATPTLTGVRATAAGDLVVGYGFTRFEFREEDNSVLATTEYRCATRIGEDGEFTDVLVHGEEIAAVDPSVDLEGAGDSLRILFACESSRGVRLHSSGDGGKTFGLVSEVEAIGGHMPTVCARVQDGALRTDLLYLAPTESGLELRLRHWDDLDGTGEPVDARLARASVETEDGAELRDDFQGDIVVRQVGAHGYDATEDGDDVIVVVHQETWRSRDIFWGIPYDPTEPPGEEPRGEEPNGVLRLSALELAPGLTDPVPSPDPLHRHQLRLLALD